MTDDHRPDLDESGSVRPYVITGGRTRATDADLAIETVVRSTASVAGAALDFERRAIAELCVEPQSIAEISGHLDLPLGVARFLASDMASEGLLQANPGSDPTDRAFIEKLRDGIRAL